MKTTSRILVVAVALMAVGLLAAGPSLAQETAMMKPQVCPGFEKEHRVERWHVHPFAKEGAQSIVALQEQFKTHEAELRALLEQQGLGNVADSLFDVVASGTRINETQLQKGQTLHWMVFRKDDQPMAVSDVCVATDKDNGAFEISVPVVTDKRPGNPRCALSVDCNGETANVSVNASGSSSGVKVTVDGPEGQKTLIDGSGTTWNGSVQEPYTGSYTFTATASAEGTETVTTYTFVVPKACFNLSLSETSAETRSAGEKSCTETKSFNRQDPLCTAPPPECAIAVDPTEAKTGDPVSVNVTGHWAEGGLDLQVKNQKGEAVHEPMLSGPSETVSFSSPGSYTISGTATNEAGEKASCEAGVEITGRWVLRFFGAWLDPDSNEVRGETTLSDGSPFRGHGNLDNGRGIGASAEYKFNDRFGLEGRGLFGRFDSGFTIDIGEDWARDDDTIPYWELDFGPNFHLTPNSRVDLYVGPFVGWGNLDDGKYSALGRSVTQTYDSGVLWGGQVGLDWPFTVDGNWGLHFGGRYTDFSVDVVNPIDGSKGSVDINPLELELGLSYTF